MFNKIRSFLDKENAYFFGIKNSITGLLVIFFLIDSAFLGLNHGLTQINQSQQEEDVAGVTAEEDDVEIVVKEEEEDEGKIFNYEPPADLDEPEPGDDESGKILQEAAFIAREELEDADISADNSEDDSVDNGNGEDADESKEGGVGGESGSADDTSDTADSNYTAEEQAVVDKAEEVCFAVSETNGELFYSLLSVDYQTLFGKQAVLDAFANQCLDVSAVEIISDPEMVGEAYAQLKVRFTFTDNSTSDYWVYLVREDGEWRLMGTRQID